MQSDYTVKFRLSPMMLACQLLCMSLSGAAFAEAQPEAAAQPAAADEAKSEGTTNVVTITGRKAGMGLMVREDAPKARSTVNREELAKQRPTGNPYQAMDLMPSVNAYNYDASGLFGGGLTMRGFNSDQIGVTVNGVPVNDSGSYSVFPQEFVDQENVCSEFVTQGSTDVESPHVGATGGNLGIVTCDPEDKRRVRIMQTIGTMHLAKTFVRFDTGRVADDKAKFFLSYSHAQSDKWKGQGGARRDHIDFAFRWDFDRFNYINGAILYNRAFNNNFFTPTLAQLSQFGYDYDYAATFTGHKVGVKGTADVESQSPAYYKLSTNPFENMIASATGKFRLGESTDIKVTPYYWYGYGTGGTQEKTLSETGFLNTATGKLGAGVDLNGDGDTKDTILIGNTSVTRTDRPGITASVTHYIGDHTIFAGFWYERATHRQTGPAELLDANGNLADAWFRSNYILRPDGTPYESRDWRTTSTAYQPFLQDTISMMNDNLRINIGVRRPTLKRDFINYANEGAQSQVGYEITPSYTETLPQFGIRYSLTPEHQLFAALAKNMKAPPNFAFSSSNGSNVTIDANGNPVLSSVVQPETSWNLDVGYRYQSPAMIASVALYAVDYRNRMANSFDPISQRGAYVNAGSVKDHGIDFEIGNTPIHGWSFYASLSTNASSIQSDVPVAVKVGANTVSIPLPTTGKEMPLAPRLKMGLSAQYETADWYVRLKGKHTSTQYATLTNDEEVPSYNIFDLDGGYQFRTGEGAVFKNPTLRFNVSNLFNTQYRNPASQNTTNATAVVTPAGTISANSVTYYLGAPRSASVTLTVDF